MPSHLPRVLEYTCIFNTMGNATTVRNLRVLDFWLARQSRYSEEIGDWTKRFVLVHNTDTHELAGSSEMSTDISRRALEMDDSCNPNIQRMMSTSRFISHFFVGLAARTQSTRAGSSPPHSRPLESGEFMPVRSKCRKGSEVSLSRVPRQWCGSGGARGALVVIGGEISPGVWRNEMERLDGSMDAQLTSVCGACTWVYKRGGTRACRFRCLSVYLGRYRGLVPCEIPGFG